MQLSKQVRPISYFKAHAAKIISNLKQNTPLIITQNGKATAVLQDIASFEQMQETLALLKILALSNRQITSEQVIPANKAIEQIRNSRRTK